MIFVIILISVNKVAPPTVDNNKQQSHLSDDVFFCSDFGQQDSLTADFDQI